MADEPQRDDTRRPGATLRAASVSRAFEGVHALREVTLELHTGEIVGLIGPNGAGKSTLVNLLTGFDRPSSGTVELQGRDVTRWSASRRGRHGLARTFQHSHPFRSLSVRENVEVAALGAGASPAEARGTADRLSSASDYIEGVLNQTAVREEMKRNASSPLPPPPPSPAPAVMPAPFFRAPGGVAYSYPEPPDLEQRSRAPLSGKSLQMQSELEQNGPWQRITIAPGIELHFVLTDDAQTNSIAAQILEAAQEILEENTGELP